ncbi:MAG: glycoside hydrolase family 2 protein, partial [Streptomyces sp.]|nr:glycoside hydrolase family 2 protein [Streptomyces sp.]
VQGRELAVVNQAAEAWAGAVRLRRMTVEGAVIGEAEVEFTAGARAVARVGVPEELVPGGPKEFLVADAEGSRALHFPAADREIPYPRPEFDVSVAPDGSVTVVARSLVRDLLLQADRLDPDARADRGLVTLLAGERVTIGVSGWKTPDADAARSALYCMEPSR